MALHKERIAGLLINVALWAIILTVAWWIFR